MTAKRPHVLATAFEPFGGEATNSSQQVLSQLTNKHFDYNIKTAVLPVVFGESVRQLKRLISRFNPHAVICLGQAGGRAEVSLERVAVNLDDARIPDNANVKRTDCRVVEGAPDAYFTRLPVKQMMLALQAKKIPCKVSMTAGTFVCNHIMFALLDLIATSYQDMRGGFIHLPFLPGQAARHNAPGMPLEQMTEAVATCIEVCLVPEVSQLAVGETH